MLLRLMIMLQMALTLLYHHLLAAPGDCLPIPIPHVRFGVGAIEVLNAGTEAPSG